MQDGVLIAGSWLAVIFNPSFPYRMTHMLLASGITACFVVAGLSAWRLLRAADDPSAQKTLRFATHVAAVLVPIQVVVGDLHGLNIARAPAGEDRRGRGAVEDREGRGAGAVRSDR